MIAQPFEHWADWYDDLYLAQGREPEAELRSAAPIIAADGHSCSTRRILDLGCGTGRMIPALSRFGVVTGVDASDAMLRVARRRFPTVTLMQAEFDAAKSLEPWRESADMASMLFGVCAYASDEGQARAWLANAAALLRPGGLLLVSVELVRESLSPAQERMVRVNREGDWLERRSTARVLNGTLLEVTFRFTLCASERRYEWEERHTHLIASTAEWLTWIREACRAAPNPCRGALMRGSEVIVYDGTSSIAGVAQW